MHNRSKHPHQSSTKRPSPRWQHCATNFDNVWSATDAEGCGRKPRPTVETTPRIYVGDLLRSLCMGLARVGTVNVVIDGKPEVLDVVFDDRNYGGRGQPYFLCGTCSKKVMHLFLRDDPRDGQRLTCRRCAGPLTYAAQHTRRR